MKIYQLHEGNNEKAEVLMILDRKEAKVLHGVFEEYIKQPIFKRKQMAKKLFKQINDEFWIF